MTPFTLLFLLSVPSALLAVKCTDPPGSTENPDVDDDFDDMTTWGPMSTVPPTPDYPPPTSWPKGRFALLMSGEDCPEFTSWKKGHIYQDTEDDASTNSWSPYTHMKGPLKTDGYNFHFCSKRSKSGDATWPTGNYCIYRSGNKCPNKDFMTGSITFDDEDKGNMNFRKGMAPSGVYERDTTIYFCCREDGNANDPIDLPVTKPFYLLPYTSGCQKVWRMDITQESIFFDLEDDNENTFVDGAVPSHYQSGNNIHLGFCHYSLRE